MNNGIEIVSQDWVIHLKTFKELISSVNEVSSKDLLKRNDLDVSFDRSISVKKLIQDIFKNHPEVEEELGLKGRSVDANNLCSVSKRFLEEIYKEDDFKDIHPWLCEKDFEFLNDLTRIDCKDKTLYHSLVGQLRFSKSILKDSCFINILIYLLVKKKLASPSGSQLDDNEKNNLMMECFLFDLDSYIKFEKLDASVSERDYCELLWGIIRRVVEEIISKSYKLNVAISKQLAIANLGYKSYEWDDQIIVRISGEKRKKAPDSLVKHNKSIHRKHLSNMIGLFERMPDQWISKNEGWVINLNAKDLKEIKSYDFCKDTHLYSRLKRWADNKDIIIQVGEDIDSLNFRIERDLSIALLCTRFGNLCSGCNNLLRR